MVDTGASSGPGTRNPVKIIANIFISFIGAGVLGLPYAFKEGGILEGILIMSAVGALSVKAMLMIIDCKYKIIDNKKERSINKNELYEKTELLIGDEVKFAIPNGISKIDVDSSMSYGEVGEHILGHYGRILIDIAIIISQVGFTCAYLIFISENMSTYVPSLTKGHWLVIILPPLFLLTLLRELHKLAFASLFAQISNLFAFAVVFWFDFEHYNVVSFHPKEFSLKGFPFFFSVAIYCYEGAGMILSLEASLEKDYRYMFRRYFVTIISAVTVLYITFGVSGYISFGPHTREIITLNLSDGNGLDFAALVKMCLSIAMFFTYPVMLFPVIKLLEQRLIRSPGSQAFHENLIRLILVSVTGLIVLAIPNFANLMAIVGATFCSLIAFILPGIFHFQLFKRECTRSQLIIDVILIMVGIIGCLIGTWDAIKRLMSSS